MTSVIAPCWRTSKKIRRQPEREGEKNGVRLAGGAMIQVIHPFLSRWHSSWQVLCSERVVAFSLAARASP